MENEIPDITAKEVANGRLKQLTREDHSVLDKLIAEVDALAEKLNVKKT